MKPKQERTEECDASRADRRGWSRAERWSKETGDQSLISDPASSRSDAHSGPTRHTETTWKLIALCMCVIRVRSGDFTASAFKSHFLVIHVYSCFWSDGMHFPFLTADGDVRFPTGILKHVL